MSLQNKCCYGVSHGGPISAGPILSHIIINEIVCERHIVYPEAWNSPHSSCRADRGHAVWMMPCKALSNAGVHLALSNRSSGDSVRNHAAWRLILITVLETRKRRNMDLLYCGAKARALWKGLWVTSLSQWQNALQKSALKREKFQLLVAGRHGAGSWANDGGGGGWESICIVPWHRARNRSPFQNCTSK